MICFFITYNKFLFLYLANVKVFKTKSHRRIECLACQMHKMYWRKIKKNVKYNGDKI